MTNYYSNKKVVTEVEFEKLKSVGDSYTVSDGPYGRVMKLGELDGIIILSLTCPDLDLSPAEEPAPLDYVKLLYRGLRQSFAPYSEHMILYYLYKRPGINGVLTTKHFTELCGLNEKAWKKSGATAATEVKSTGGTEVDEPVVKIVGGEPNTGTPSLAETVKCSTVDTNEEGGLNLLEFPSVADESYDVTWPEKERKTLECVKKGIDKGESSLVESEANSMCTNNLVAIEEDAGTSSPMKTAEEATEAKDLSRIQVEEVAPEQQQVKKEKNTFIEEIGDILKEIGPPAKK